MYYDITVTLLGIKLELLFFPVLLFYTSNQNDYLPFNNDMFETSIFTLFLYLKRKKNLFSFYHKIKVRK